MEAFSVVASVGSIIQLAASGLTAAKYLIRIYEECSTEVIKAFIENLVHSSVLLQDVQDICMRIQQHQNPMVSKIRVASLQLNLEDCIRDLQAWHIMTKRFDSGSIGSVGSRVAKYWITIRGGTIEQRFARVFKAIFKESMLGIGADARNKIQQRFQQHHTNVGTALAVLQVDIGLLQFETLDTFKAHFGIDYESQKREKEHQNPSDLRNSNSSLLALSKSHDERLRELQTASSELSEKLDSVIRALSSHSSVSSSAVSNSNLFTAIGQDHKDNDLASRGTQNLEPEQSENDDYQAASEFPATRENVNPVFETEAFTEVTEFSDLFRLIEDFHTLTGQYFADVIAEYCMAAEEWRATHLRLKLLEAIQKNENASRFLFDSKIRADLSQTASRLLSLRRKAAAESLDDVLTEADSVLGLSRGDVAAWEDAVRLLTDQNSKAKLLQQLDRTMLHVDTTESQVRLNEWLLLVMLSTPHLAVLHRTSLTRMLPSSFLSRAPILQAVDPTSSASMMHRDEWERLTIKFWLLDGSDAMHAAAYAASAFTNSKESESTIIACDATSGDDGSNMLDMDPEPDNIMLRELYLARGLFPDGTAIKVDHDAAPEGASQSNLAKAEMALQDYQREPAKAPTEE